MMKSTSKTLAAALVAFSLSAGAVFAGQTGGDTYVVANDSCVSKAQDYADKNGAVVVQASIVQTSDGQACQAILLVRDSEAERPRRVTVILD